MSKITLSKVAAPSTPAAGKIVLYFKSDGLLYKKDETGTEVAVGGAGGGDFSGPASATDGHVVLFDGVTGKLGKSAGASLPVKATGAEVTTGTDDAKFATPKAIKDAGIVATPVKASAAEALAGSDDAKFLTAVSAKGLPSIYPDSTPDADHTAHGIKATFTAHDAQAFGDMCFLNADGELAIADADAIASGVVVAMCADASIAADASGNYLLFGSARDDSWDWTPGGLIYLSTTGTTGNTMTQTAPSGTDDCIVILGVATHADRMIFNPQLVIVEHA